jgi:hypothetical protein
MIFAPKLPISTAEKVSIDMGIQLLLDHFGIEHLSSRSNFLPTDQAIGVKLLRDENDVEPLRDRIANIFDLPAQSVDFTFDHASNWSVEPEVSIEDGKVTAQFEKHFLDDPVRVATQLAIGFSTALLRSAIGVSQSNSAVCGELTELVAVWFGLGSFLAESSVKTSQVMIGGVDQWSVSRLGQLTATQTGYAMAVRSYLFEERLPKWHSKLTIDAKESMAKSLKYLKKTGDCLVDENQSCIKWNSSECQLRTRSQFASQRYAALGYFPIDGEVLSDSETVATLRLIEDRDTSVRQRAFQLLEYAPLGLPEVAKAIELGFDDRDLLVRSASIRASALHGDSIDGLRGLLQSVLRENDLELMVDAAASLATNNLCDDEILKLILDKLKRSLVRGAEGSVSLAEVLEFIDDDPKQLVSQYFSSDQDLMNDALALFD